MPHVSPRVERIAGGGAAAWTTHTQALADLARGEDVIIMSVGDPDLATPEATVEAAVRALRGGDTHYSDVRGQRALRVAIGEEIVRLGGPRYVPDDIAVFAGAQNALFAASLCLLSPGDEVIVIDPMYVTYEAYLGVSGATLVRVASSAASGFRPDLDAIARAAGPRTRAIAFSNPNNPTGVVMRRDELEAIGEIARKHDLWIISDEVYATLTFDREHVVTAGLQGLAERTVTVSSVSKSHAMTGWRVGWMAAPDTLIEHAANLALCMNYGLPGFVQAGATHALQHDREAAMDMREIYRVRRDIVIDALDPVPGLHITIPEAGMFAVLDVARTGLSSALFMRRLYERERVSVLDGTAFGTSTDGCVRLSFACSEAQLVEGCTRIARFVSSLDASTAP